MLQLWPRLWPLRALRAARPWMLALLACLAAACAAPAAPSAPAATTQPSGVRPATAPAASVPGAAATTAPTAAAPAAGVPAAGAPAALAPPPAPLPAPLKVRMGSVGSLVDGPLFVAMDRGYFAEVGIDIEETRAEGATRLIAPLAAGQIDVFGAAMAAGMFNAFAREIDVRLVADKGRIPPGHGNAGLVVRQDLWESGVRSMADLRGRKLGIAGHTAGSAVILFLGYGLEQRGLSLDGIELVDVTLPDLNAAMSNRALDGGIQIEPLLTIGQANGLFSIMHRSDELYPNLQSGFILYSADFARSQPEAARRWMVGYLRGSRAYHDAFERNRDRAEIVDIVARATAVRDVSLFDRMVSSYMDPNGRMNVQSLIDAQDWYAAHGFIPQKVDVQRLVDYQFLDYALSVLGEYR